MWARWLSWQLQSRSSVSCRRESASRESSAPSLSRPACSSSRSRCFLHCALEYPLRGLRPGTSRHDEPPALRLVVRTEEMLDLSQLLLGQRFHVTNDGLVHRRLDHAEQPIVADRLAALSLLRADDADEVNQNQASREQRCFIQHHDVQGIAVLCARARNRAEIEWERHARRQYPAELEQPNLGIELVLVAAGARRIDDDADQPRVRIVRSQVHEIHCFAPVARKPSGSAYQNPMSTQAAPAAVHATTGEPGKRRTPATYSSLATPSASGTSAAVTRREASCRNRGSSAPSNAMRWIAAGAINNTTVIVTRTSAAKCIVRAGAGSDSNDFIKGTSS